MPIDDLLILLLLEIATRYGGERREYLKSLYSRRETDDRVQTWMLHMLCSGHGMGIEGHMKEYILGHPELIERIWQLIDEMKP